MPLIESLVHTDPFEAYQTSCFLYCDYSFFFIFPKNYLTPPRKIEFLNDIHHYRHF